MTVYKAYKMVTQDGLARKLYDYIDHEYSEEAVMADLEHGYLTIDDGFDDKTYIWYEDEVCEGAICIEDGSILSNLEGILWV